MVRESSTWLAPSASVNVAIFIDFGNFGCLTTTKLSSSANSIVTTF